MITTKKVTVDAAEKKAAVKAAEPVAEKKVPEKKAEVKPEVKAEAKTEAKPEAAKKAAPKKAVEPKAKKAAAKPDTTVKTSFCVQYAGKEYTEKELVAAVKKAYVKLGNKAADIKSVEVYLKPEENVAYYVINGKGSDDFKIEL